MGAVKGWWVDSTGGKGKEEEEEEEEGWQKYVRKREGIKLEKRMKPAVQVHVLAIAGKRIACFQGECLEAVSAINFSLVSFIA